MIEICIDILLESPRFMGDILAISEHSLSFWRCYSDETMKYDVRKT